MLSRCLLLCVMALAWGSRAQAQSIQRQSWTTEDGLPQNSVHALLQSTDGFLWLATEGGAARFDGIHFDRYSTENTPAFSSNDLCCIVQTADGAIYFGTSDGVVRLLAGRFERVAGVAAAVLAMQRQSDGTLLLLTANALFEVRGLQSSNVALPNALEATALGEDERGGPLVAAGSVLLRHKGSGWQKDRDLPVAPLGFFEKAGGLWLQTRAEIIEIAPGRQTLWRLGKELPGTRLESLSSNADGVFAGTNQGLFQLQPGTSHASLIDPLRGTAVLSILVDREGDRWFGTDSSGLIVLRQRAISSVPELASDTITCVVATADGTLWLGTRDAGLHTVRSGVVATPQVSSRLASQVILSLAPDVHDGLWVGTPEGLDRITGNEVRHITSADGLPDDFVRSLLAEPDGSVWAGTRRGMAYLRDGKVQRVLTRADGLPSDVIGSMLRSSVGDLWIGTFAGLARISAGTARVTTTQELQGQTITALAETANGSVWIGSRNGGLHVYRNGRLFSISAPALNTTVSAIVPDNAGRLWLHTPNGLAQAKVAELEACAEAKTCSAHLRQYGTADGMSSVDASFDGHPSAWRTASGELWFAGRRGVSSVNTAHLAVDAVAPPVVIEQVLIDDVGVPYAHGLHLSSGHRRIEVNYAGLSLYAPSQVRYRFRLEGYDKDWTDAGNRRTAEYTNLPSGSYQLIVEARNVDGVVSTSPAVLAIQIDPPIYRRWWFYLLVLALAGSLVYAMYWLRLRRVRREFDAVLGERNRIAREIHDTLAQDFVAVSLQLEITSQLLRKEKVEAAREQIESTRLLVRDGIRDARESIWALRAGNHAESLPARLQAIVDAQKTSETNAEFSVTGAYRALSSSLEKEVLRIVKEALGNAIRHASAKTVRVGLIYSEDAIAVQVSDDGAGFDLQEGAARKGHYGLRGMQERARAMAGTLTIDSAPGAGTTVKLHLPSR